MTTQTKTRTRSPRPAAPEEGQPMWVDWLVELQFDGAFAASIPRTPEEIRNMLTHRQPGKEPPGAVAIDVMAQQVADEVSTPLAGEEPPEEGEFLPGWATFKRDEQGIYYEGRCIRGHLKDCATQIVPFVPHIPAFKSKVVNKVQVLSKKIYLDRHEFDGTETRFIQVMTRQGPRSSIKMIDFILEPRMSFRLRVLNDGVITERELRLLFEYGGTHGMGQERSAGPEWGRYELVRLARLEPNEES